MSDLYHGPYPVDMTVNEARAEVLSQMKAAEPFVTDEQVITELVGFAIERAWNSDKHPFYNLPPIDLSPSERRGLAVAAIEAFRAGVPA